MHLHQGLAAWSEGDWYPDYPGQPVPAGALNLANLYDTPALSYSPTTGQYVAAPEVFSNIAPNPTMVPVSPVAAPTPIVSAPVIEQPIIIDERETIQPVTSGTDRDSAYDQLLRDVRQAQLDLANARTAAERAAAQARLDQLTGGTTEYEPGSVYVTAQPGSAQAASEGKGTLLALLGIGAALFLGN